MFDSLANHFLIAMPSMQDPNFSRTVTYICEHTDEGAMGIIINRPADLTLGEIMDSMGLETDKSATNQTEIYQGGPVQPERGFVLHRPYSEWDSTLKVSEELGVTTSRDVLIALAADEGPDDALIALGYAGWGAGQLEKEMSDNSWLNGPADLQVIFDIEYNKRWEAAAKRLGVDLNLISGETGHA